MPLPSLLTVIRRLQIPSPVHKRKQEAWIWAPSPEPGGKAPPTGRPWRTLTLAAVGTARPEDASCGSRRGDGDSSRGGAPWRAILCPLPGVFRPGLGQQLGRFICHLEALGARSPTQTPPLSSQHLCLGGPQGPSSLLTSVNNRFCREVCAIEPSPQMPTPADVSTHSSNILGWPKSLLAFFHTISWKNPNELFGQPNTCVRFLCGIVVVEQGSPST